MAYPFSLVDDLSFLLGRWPTPFAWSMLYLFCLANDLAIFYFVNDRTTFAWSMTYPFCFVNDLFACYLVNVLPFWFGKNSAFLLGQ